ncbi:MAG: amidohydrolase [Fimbriimonadaceae bacterium]|nr:amidohydrolase [Fimbriimonadaceae bacterium]
MNLRLAPDDLRRIIEFRHDLHAHPELGYRESRTSQKVQEALSGLGIEFRAGLAGGTGILARIPATHPNAEPVALRADMDALPIMEKTGLEYASTVPNIMHACGHDGHTSMLLGTATLLSQLPVRPHNILLLFQPAEEGGAGGMKMCEDGVLDGKVLGQPADRIYGLHGHPYTTVGQVSTRVGPMMASADSFHARIVGKGGHAAMPQSTIDPIVITSQIVLAWQTIASRSVDPLDPIVVTCAEIHAGVAHNVIPECVEVSGTLRALRESTRSMGIQKIEEIARGIAILHGAKFEIDWMQGYPVTSNDAEAESRWRTALQEFSGDVLAEPVVPVMGAEDFSFYGGRTKACFYWLGLNTNPDHKYPNLHAPEFDFNDAAIPYGVEAMCRLALAS